MKKYQIIFAFILVAVSLASRLIPHPDNFTSLIAVALFAGSFWAQSQIRFVIPLFVLFVTDAHKGFYPGIELNYLAIVCAILMAPVLESSLFKVTWRGLLASVLFFMISNLGVWWSAGIYEKSINGLIDCYMMGIPFFKNTLISTIFYSSIFYSSYRVIVSEKGFQGFFSFKHG